MLSWFKISVKVIGKFFSAAWERAKLTNGKEQENNQTRKVNIDMKKFVLAMTSLLLICAFAVGTALAKLDITRNPVFFESIGNELRLYAVPDDNENASLLVDETPGLSHG
ncbi:hypothetical protein D0466_20165 [Peribacillus glennii]|uniref:Uncharacterized protein n=1 Tax=Peribacillus glennii TaxID=2303991 RepID=A0A372L6X6_9BACI|nr:hypothetical protein D0466_20165 [Peribacillus glennii]